MIVLKSKYDALAAEKRQIGAALSEALAERDAARLSRDLWRTSAWGFETRALKAEGELARRKAHALSNLKQNRAKALEGVGG